MLGNIIAIFKARNDPDLAKHIASEMVIDGAIDYLSGPIVIAKFWMGLALIGLFVITALLIWTGALLHWTIAIPSLLFIGVIYVIIRIWSGLNRGVDKVAQIAKTEITQKVKAIKPPSDPSNL